MGKQANNNLLIKRMTEVSSHQRSKTKYKNITGWGFARPRTPADQEHHHHTSTSSHQEHHHS
jgi:hypothetical protein